MKAYRNELEALSFSKEEKERMTRRLLEQGGKRRRRTGPCRGLAAAAAAVVLLAGAVGAVSLAGVSPAFRALFGAEDDQQAQRLGAEQMEQVFYDRNGSGASITLLEVVNDQEQLYARVRFAPPAGVELPVPEPVEDGYACSLGGRQEGGGPVSGFYEDEACTRPVKLGAMSYGFTWLEESAGTEGLEFIYTMDMRHTLPPEAAYCGVLDIGSLYMQHDGAWQAVLDGMDIDLVIPRAGTAPCYLFQGSCTLPLNKGDQAAVEHLALSAISVTFDLDIPMGPDGAEPVYDLREASLLMADGSRVETELILLSRQRGLPEDGSLRREHIRLLPVHPVDVQAVDGILLTLDAGAEGTPVHAAVDLSTMPRQAG